MPSIATFIAPLFTALVGGVAIFALHHLRPRPVDRIVETLLFWDPSDQYPVARSLWSRRLRQPLALLVLLTIAMTLAVAMLLCRWQPSHQAFEAVVVDAGSASANADGTLLAPELLSAIQLPRDSAVVIAAAEQPRVIADVDEPPAIAQHRLASLRPSKTASAASQALQLAASMQGRDGGRITWFTSQASLPDDLPSTVAARVDRHWVKPVDRLAITSVAFKVSPEDPTIGTLIITVGGSTTRLKAVIEISSEGAATKSVPIDLGPTQANAVVFESFAADGRQLRIKLTSTQSPVSTATTLFALPRQSPPRFFGVQNAPLSLKQALLSVGESTDHSQGAIAILPVGGPIPSDAVGAIEIVSDIGAANTLQLQSTSESLMRGLGLQGAQLTVGNSVVPGDVVMLSAGQHIVVALSTKGPQPVAYIDAAAITPDAQLPRLAAFPLLVQRLCNALNRNTPASTVVLSKRHVDDPMWQTNDSLSPAIVSATPPTTELPGIAEMQMTASSNLHLDWPQILLGICVALMLFEACLFAGRKIS